MKTNNFNTNKRILYLLPTPSMKGGMTATTQMFYDIGLFNQPNFYHFDTMFKWGTSPFIRFFESPILKIKFIGALIKYKPDVIYVIMSPYWGFYDKIAYCLIAKVFGVKSIFNSVSGRFIKFYENNIINQVLVRRCLKVPDAIVLGSAFWINYFRKIRSDIQLCEIGNPVISEVFDRKKNPSKKIKVLTACRLTKSKGTIELAAVIKKICAETNQFEFVILGDGPELEWLQNELAEQIQNKQVYLNGFVIGEEKTQYFVDSNVFLMLTHFDMMPISILEAMSASLAVFSTKTGSIPDLIKEGVNGHLFDIGEVDDVVNKLLFYQDKTNEIAQMGKNANTLIKNNYDIEIVITKQLNLIDSLFKNKMSFWDRLYNKVPFYIQNIGVSLFGYKWKRRRFGGIFEKEYKEYKNRENFTKNDWTLYQEKQLRKLLIHAQNHVPYYKALFKEKGLTETQLKEFKLQDLHKIPFLEKNTLRTECKSTLLAENLEKDGEYYSSSGSTGTPTNILFSAKMHQKWSAAFEARIRNWAGLTIKNARGMIGGRRVIPSSISKGPFYRYNSAERQVYFSAYHISAKHAVNYVRGMKKYALDYMTGYAMSNYFLARFIEENKIEAPKLKAVITSSEKLTQEMRATFKRVYGCKSYDSYSGVEACGLISECEHGKLHISPDVAIIEIIKSDGTYAKPGEEGEAICTGFLNYDQPLIRYRIGDVIKLSANQQCKCGRHMPVVDEIIGRVEDTVIGADGREMVRFHGIFINIPSIIEGQVIQHTIKDFEVKIVVSERLTPLDEKLIVDRMKSQLGDINVQINTVDFIPRNQNGKFKAVISHVKNDRLSKN